mmetsp:Transcript_11741/g.20614  ORF Transcript_11741/g.20614 Transcript_11741/m.20614 type:complete len:207 (-) Transcript_11741:202-822(-)
MAAATQASDLSNERHLTSPRPGLALTPHPHLDPFNGLWTRRDLLGRSLRRWRRLFLPWVAAEVVLLGRLPVGVGLALFLDPLPHGALTRFVGLVVHLVLLNQRDVLQPATARHRKRIRVDDVNGHARLNRVEPHHFRIVIHVCDVLAAITKDQALRASWGAAVHVEARFELSDGGVKVEFELDHLFHQVAVGAVDCYHSLWQLRPL